MYALGPINRVFTRNGRWFQVKFAHKTDCFLNCIAGAFLYSLCLRARYKYVMAIIRPEVKNTKFRLHISFGALLTVVIRNRNRRPHLINHGTFFFVILRRYRFAAYTVQRIRIFTARFLSLIPFIDCVIRVFIFAWVALYMCMCEFFAIDLANWVFNCHATLESMPQELADQQENLCAIVTLNWKKIRKKRKNTHIWKRQIYFFTHFFDVVVVVAFKCFRPMRDSI